jgi:hypothetical protein
MTNEGRYKATKKQIAACPNGSQHHPHIPKHVDVWNTWAADMLARGYHQVKCWGCDRYVIWERKIEDGEDEHGSVAR